MHELGKLGVEGRVKRAERKHRCGGSLDASLCFGMLVDTTVSHLFIFVPDVNHAHRK